MGLWEGEGEAPPAQREKRIDFPGRHDSIPARSESQKPDWRSRYHLWLYNDPRASVHVSFRSSDQ